MILGLRTAVYHTPDLAVGKAWYARFFEVEPYFDEPFYVGFNIGGFELGLLPDREPGPGGQQAYWGVPDITKEVERLASLGIPLLGEVQDVGGGIKVAECADPFGNRVALIENPHFQLSAVR